MAKKPTRTRRTPEQLIEDLQKQIEAVKARAARAKVKKDPALRHINGAVRSIDKAAKATGDNAVRKALEDARATLGACLAMNPKGVLTPKRAAARVDPAAVLAYVRKNAGSSAEQIADAQGTDTKTLRPVLRELIEAGEVKASGKARGTRYAAG
jgi:predicted ArsR family transcriptional regulator